MEYMLILPQVRGDSQRCTAQRFQERSPKEHASKLPLLALLEETEKQPSTSPLRVEEVPAVLAQLLEQICHQPKQKRGGSND